MKSNMQSKVDKKSEGTQAITNDVSSTDTHGNVAVVFENSQGVTALMMPTVLDADDRKECAARALNDLKNFNGEEWANCMLKNPKELVGMLYYFAMGAFDCGHAPLSVEMPKLAQEMIAILGPVNCVIDFRSKFNKAVLLSDEEYERYLSKIENIRILERDWDDEDEGGYYDVGHVREQLVTFLLPKAISRGTVLQFRVSTRDKRISKDLALEELEDRQYCRSTNRLNRYQNIPVRQRVWERCNHALNRYLEDPDKCKDIALRLETTLLVDAQHLCATYPVENNFMVDLTAETKRRVELDPRSESTRLRSRKRWTHLDHYDMSGDFRWYPSSNDPPVSHTTQ